MKTIINIGRSFGSGGGYVGHAIGQQLGIPFYDNERISRAAEERGYSPNLFASEQQHGFFHLSSFFVSGRPGHVEGHYTADHLLFEIQSTVIREISAEGDAIFIGRCADYILREMPCFNVFISAPESYRIQRLTESEGITEEQAARLIRRKDRTRETYYNYYAFGAWGKADNYHLCVDSSVLGIEETAAYIIDYGRRAGKIR